MAKRKSLRVGVLLNNSKNGIIICLDGTFRVVPSIMMNESHPYDIVLFEDSKTDSVRFIITLKDFSFFDNTKHIYDKYNKILYQEENGICVPDECIEKSQKFIVDSGSGYQFVIYCDCGTEIYVDWRYTETERELIRTYFVKQKFPTFIEIFDEIENYIEKINIEQILDSFVIINKEYFRNCPGKDDWYFVHKMSKRFEDNYINSLFPQIDEEIYRDHGFSSADSMSIIGVDKSMPERAYIEEEQKFIKEAKEKYNENEHRRFLLNERILYFQSLIEKEYKKNQELYLSFFSEPLKILKNDEVNKEYAQHLNYFLRMYYRMTNNNEEIDWHKFYDHIVRD